MKVAKTLRGTFVCDEMRELRKAIDKETEWLKRYRRNKIDDAINWADWYCTDLMYAIDDQGRERYIAYFEEGAPDTHQFFDQLQERLPDAPCPILFEAEW